jgi:hypothetical protein
MSKRKALETGMQKEKKWPMKWLLGVINLIALTLQCQP